MGDPPRYFRAAALDYDGTLAEGGAAAPETLSALRETRASGVRTVLVTGRILPELRSVCPDLWDRFDAIVAENGAVLEIQGEVRRLAPPVAQDLDPLLTRRGVVFRRGDVILATRGRFLTETAEAIRELGLACRLVHNRGEMMVIPSEIDKGTGVVQALAELGVSPRNAVAVGDAENDHSLLRSCELGVAVANGVTALKLRADLVLPHDNGAGVRTLLRGPVFQGGQKIPPLRRQVRLGRDSSGAAVGLPGSQVNLLVAGGSRSGKSWISGLLAERLIAMGYRAVIFDPEGDHGSLGAQPDTAVLGDGQRPPDAHRLRELIGQNIGSFVLDLSLLSPEETVRYTIDALRVLKEERRRTGLPHWIFLDEAHMLFNAGGNSGADIVAADLRGYCLSTYLPEELDSAVLHTLDAAVLLPGGLPISGRPERAEVLAAIFGVSVGDIRPPKNETDILLLRNRHRPPVQRLTPDRRRSSHERHRRKYRRFQLPHRLCFHFREGDGPVTEMAANITEFEEVVERCPGRTLAYHAGRRDFSRWFRDVFQEPGLGRRIRGHERQVPSDPGDADVAAFRKHLIQEIETRFAE